MDKPCHVCCHETRNSILAVVYFAKQVKKVSQAIDTTMLDAAIKRLEKNLAKCASISILILFLSGCALTPKWDNTEKTMLGVLLVAHAADGLTTSMAMSHGMEESNPLYGSYASDGELVMVKASSIVINVVLADMMPSHGVRKFLLGIGTVPSSVAAVHNYNKLRGNK